MDMRSPLTIPTAHAPGHVGVAKLSPNVIDAAQVYYARKAIYGRPSEQPSTATFREHVVSVQAFHVEPPDRGEFRRPQIVWRGAPNAKFARAPYGFDTETQMHRTFGGVPMPYYQALATPTLNDVAKYMGGVLNVRAS